MDDNIKTNLDEAEYKDADPVYQYQHRDPPRYSVNMLMKSRVLKLQNFDQLKRLEVYQDQL